MSPRAIPRSERYDVPQKFVDLAQRRTEFLFPHLTYNMPLKLALACAWMQGANDVVEAMDKQAGRTAEPHCAFYANAAWSGECERCGRKWDWESNQSQRPTECKEPLFARVLPDKRTEASEAAPASAGKRE